MGISAHELQPSWAAAYSLSLALKLCTRRGRKSCVWGSPSSASRKEMGTEEAEGFQGRLQRAGSSPLSGSAVTSGERVTDAGEDVMPFAQLWEGAEGGGLGTSWQ